MSFPFDFTINEAISHIIDQLIPDPRLRSGPSEYSLSVGDTILQSAKTVKSYVDEQILKPVRPNARTR